MKNPDAEFIDALREVLGLSPWWGSERAAWERAQIDNPRRPMATGLDDSGNSRTRRVGSESSGNTKGPV
jgi:hypothetical protein